MKLSHILLFTLLALISGPAHAADLKKTRSSIIGKWSISEKETMAIPPVSDPNNPWIPKKRTGFISLKPTWEFLPNGSAIIIYGPRTEKHGFHVMQDENDVVWIICNSGNGSWHMKADLLNDGMLKITPILHEVEDSGEVSAIAIH